MKNFTHKNGSTAFRLFLQAIIFCLLIHLPSPPFFPSTMCTFFGRPPFCILFLETPHLNHRANEGFFFASFRFSHSNEWRNLKRNKRNPRLIFLIFAATFLKKKKKKTRNKKCNGTFPFSQPPPPPLESFRIESFEAAYFDSK